MNIRARITIIFFSIVLIILTAFSFSIYFLSASYRTEDFYRRLKNRAINTAKILVEVEEVNADLLRRIERNNPASLPEQYIAIYDAGHNLIYSSEIKSPIQIDSTLLQQSRSRSEVKFEHESHEVVCFSFKHDSIDYIIVAVALDVYGRNALQNLRVTLITIFAISAVLVLILGWMYAGKILSPLSRLVDEVGKITEKNLDQRLNEGKVHDELGKLASTFNKMLSRLQSAFLAQKTFIANASHEIKTPITVMAGEIEVTLLHDREKSYYEKILRSVLQGLRGLNRLSTQLLVLAQTSSDEPQRNISKIRIDDVLWEAKEEAQRFHHDYSIDFQLDMDLDESSLTVNGDHQLLRVAFMNLIDNACKYSDNKTVNVNLQLRNNNKIEISFANSGAGIPADVADRIFDPFFRASSADKNIKGFGIGLSLARRIIHLHDGNIQVSSGPQELTTFTILLPTVHSI
ncbi:sensor histidine kinase [Pseudochryseolinea flava]|uniref:histidine kinase n=1 Tax=Pseudochryseolinea flava TaxID=2059302 RepID=A0A364Y485_9BACT|nr:ATP-binding protein [Pseudochryseolinea flava]RAW01549.1 hypothetical protein DQQ10_07775 [Pseudochryseolinea flava]